MSAAGRVAPKLLGISAWWWKASSSINLSICLPTSAPRRNGGCNSSAHPNHSSGYIFPRDGKRRVEKSSTGTSGRSGNFIPRQTNVLFRRLQTGRSNRPLHRTDWFAGISSVVTDDLSSGYSNCHRTIAFSSNSLPRILSDPAFPLQRWLLMDSAHPCPHAFAVLSERYLPTPKYTASWMRFTPLAASYCPCRMAVLMAMTASRYLEISFMRFCFDLFRSNHFVVDWVILRIRVITVTKVQNINRIRNVNATFACAEARAKLWVIEVKGYSHYYFEISWESSKEKDWYRKDRKPLTEINFLPDSWQLIEMSFEGMKECEK